MKTFKLKINNRIDVSQWCENYSYMYRKLYNNFDLSKNEGFRKEIIEKYNMDSWFYQTCVTEVASKKEQYETNRNNKLLKIENIEKELSEGTQGNSFAGTKGRRRKYKLQHKLLQLHYGIDKEITFGTKAILRKISYLPNYIDGLNEILQKTSEQEEKNRIEKEIRSAEELFLRSIDQYQKNRKLAIISIGEAPQRSNRKFDFDFVNKKVIFKPKSGIKIPVEFYCSPKQHKELLLLQKEIGQQPITVRIDNEHIHISFDNEKLAGYSFNENEYHKELKNIPKGYKQKRKECYRKWMLEKEERMTFGKNMNRYISFDLNPEYIGIAILERQESITNFKIIHKECIALTQLNIKLGLSSEDEIQVKQNNKRIHEIHQALKRIFNLATHYEVGNCVMEDFEFKEKKVNDSAREANRKTRNIWHREQTISSIKKHCQEFGIKLITVNACYSSFIGNIQHTYFDPVSAAIEIGRRGITKYLKGMFFPKLERSDINTMYQSGLDVQYKTISNWKEAYKLFKTSGLRYRRELNHSSENNLQSHKSCVKIYNFI